ncbi:SusC/RagA family TonB-linked outer membrane protein [Pedobacter rhizosphaerae]|uniref:TonB-linked outer membrane protein, SusC/RagA family n=1 Tax=Pedobacter rhizosphaerae TaxID=390241 RepID=A0A1H9UFU6_9SPHI|nr:SusC/RagA family TonB-linked outer membrane protein [Pedobacter rhizosphaerae]SES08138.1 TonB-linked outer membrane protein, SusC/RagA family [Pedobacter rhizosphaerae]
MKKYIRFYAWLVMCLIWSAQAYSQEKNIIINGTVIDKETRTGVPGVSIILESTNKGLTQTNGKGQFSVSAPVGGTLIFKFLGYNTQKVKVTGQTSITVTISEDRKELDQVIIVAYQKRSKETTTGSSALIQGKEVQDAPTPNIETLLQGKVPGLNIQNNTGAPGFRGSVQVRGLSTLSISGSGNESFLQPTSPLYIIDGVPLDADKAAEFGFQSQGPGISPLSLIPQEDIESIQILKDAQATSMYGSRGAYGVIIITTKRGNSKVPRIRYVTNFFAKTPPKLRETLGGNAERQLKIQQIILNAQSIDDIRRIGETSFLSDSLNAYWNNSTDWQDVFYQTTYNQSHNLAMDGGDQKFNYKANLGYYSEKGVIKNTGYDRYNLNMNMEFKPSEKFRFFGSIFGSVGKQNKGNGVGLLQSGVAANGQASTLLPPPSFYQASGGVLSALQTYNDNNSRNLRANIEGRYEFIPGLAASSTLSYDYTSDTESTFTPAAANGQFARLNDYVGRTFQLYNRNGITYAKTFGEKHNLFVNTFNEIYKQGAQAGITAQQRIPNDQLQGPVGYDAYYSRGGGVLSNYRNATIASFAGSVSYDFDKKYVAEFSYRLDGTSSSGLENPYSKNPSVGLRWNFNKENWLADKKWLDYGSLRLTWGQNIVPTGNLQSIYGIYNLNGNFNNSPTIGINYDMIPNPALKPTTTTQYNFGFDLGFFNKVTIAFDTYFKKVDNLLFDRFLANTTGFNKLASNDLGIANYGTELMISYKVINNKDFGLDFSVNGAINRDILLKLPAEYNGQYIRFDGSSYLQHNVFRVGRNTLSNYLRINQGVYQTDADVPVDPVTGKRYQSNGVFFLGGDPIMKDVNGDYILDGRDYEVTGNSQPLVTGGISANLRYKNWGLNVYATYTADRTILNNALADRIAIMRNPYALSAVVPLNDLNIWTKPGDVAKYPYPYDYKRFDQIQPLRADQTLWAESGSYLKINNVILSYMFPKKLIRKIGLNNLRIYASTDNLITFSSYSGPNPENVTPLGRDISTGYPLPRTYNIGLNLELITGN